MLLALGIAVVAQLAAAMSTLAGLVLAVAAVVLLLFQSSGSLPVWPGRTAPERPVLFGIFWGIVLGVIVPALVGVLREEGLAGILERAVSW